jgi:2-isopropylmalate synthase
VHPWRNDRAHAVTEGTDVQAEVSVRLEGNGKIATAKGADPDMLVASAKAYLGALRAKPEVMLAP